MREMGRMLSGEPAGDKVGANDGLRIWSARNFSDSSDVPLDICSPLIRARDAVDSCPKGGGEIPIAKVFGIHRVDVADV